MKKGKLRSSALLLLTACIWGVAFVAQSVGMEYVGPFTFNFVRSILGGLVLIPCIFFLNRGKKTEAEKISAEEKRAQRKTLLTGGICCGIALCLATNFQQIGIQYTTVGKAGFITACYIVIVPVIGLFYEEEMQSDDLAVGASGSCGFVSALHKRTVFNRIRRYSGICLCDSVFGTYPDRGLFFRRRWTV